MGRGLRLSFITISIIILFAIFGNAIIYTVDLKPHPAHYLEYGNVTSFDDSQFLSNVNATAILSDNDTGTYYTISDFNLTQRYHNFTDGSYETINYIISPGEITAIQINIQNVSEISNIQVCGRISRQTTNPIIAVYKQTTSYETFTGVPVTTTPNSFICVNTTTTGLVNGNNYIGIGCTSGCSNPNRYYIDTDTSSPDGNSYYWNGAVWTAQPTQDYAITVRYDQQNKTLGKALKAEFIETYDPAYTYFARMYKNSLPTSTVKIIPYINESMVNSSYIITHNQPGVGYFDINISSMVEYQTNTLGLNYTSYRIITDIDTQISEAQLNAKVNDTTEPAISPCSVSQTTIGCNESSILSCVITDDIDIKNAIFYINATDYDAMFDGNNYTYNFTPNAGNAEFDYYWNNVIAYDIVGNQGAYEPNITIQYSCCQENWVAGYGSCLVNNSKLLTYTDASACGTTDDLPIDNGTYVECDFCTTDIVVEYTTECYLSGSEEHHEGLINYTYTDNNLFSCCLITLLESDCAIQYEPYNSTYIENCSYSDYDFILDLDHTVEFGLGLGGLNSDKVYGKAFVNTTDNETEYTCVSYVETTDGDNIQTNPTYLKRTESSIFQREYEDREFFITQDHMANVYWTSQNLFLDGHEYIFGVECSDGTQILRSEHLVTVKYRDANNALSKLAWGAGNANSIVVYAFIILLVLFFLGLGIWLIKKF